MYMEADMETIENAFTSIATSGFSVAVAAFLLVRMEKELRLLREAILGLRHCSTCKLSPVNCDKYIEKEDGNLVIPA